jgi:hypothetical protein
VCRPRDQARRALLLAAVVVLPACTERISELDPRPGLSNLFFRTHLQGREPPPGMGGDFPNLASVPPRPEPPSAETRQGLSDALAADRERSRTPQGLVGSPGFAAGAGPPAPPRLAAAPAIRPDAAALPAPAAQPIPALPAETPRAPEPAALPAPPAASDAPRAPEPAAAAPPAPAPALPAPALPAPAAPPPPPSRDLLAPPPPPSRDLLAPRGG